MLSIVVTPSTVCASIQSPKLQRILCNCGPDSLSVALCLLTKCNSVINNCQWHLHSIYSNMANCGFRHLYTVLPILGRSSAQLWCYNKRLFIVINSWSVLCVLAQTCVLSNLYNSTVEYLRIYHNMKSLAKAGITPHLTTPPKLSQ